MTIACYCRVSTRHQKTDAQEAEIKRWLLAQGVNLKQVRWYLDKETGTTLQRPAFERLRRDIFNGAVKTVVVWKLDRLSRRLRDGINLLADWCERGLKIVAITQQIELNGAVGRMIAAVMLGLAEIELEYRRERQAARHCGGQGKASLPRPQARDAKGESGASEEVENPRAYRAGDCQGAEHGRTHGVAVPPTMKSWRRSEPAQTNRWPARSTGQREAHLLPQFADYSSGSVTFPIAGHWSSRVLSISLML